MLATLIDEAFDNDNWLFEIKWDGYRAIGSCINGEVDLYSRNNISFKDRYTPITRALKNFSNDVVVDGEIVSLDENGYSRFQYLQNWKSDPQGTLVYYVFDLLWIDGYDITMLPLTERKKILQQIIPAADSIRYSDHIEKSGKEFFAMAEKNGLEGIMAKNRNSVYQINSRSRDWLKIKTSLRQEVVIAGFTEPRRSRQYFGALVLGVYKNDKLEYVGHTGSGFNEKLLKDVWHKLQPFITDKCPFDEKPKTKMPVTWVKPKLVCEIKFQEWTSENILRVAIFMGLRPDKKPTEVKKETVMPTKSVNKNAASKKRSGQLSQPSVQKI